MMYSRKVLLICNIYTYMRFNYPDLRCIYNRLLKTGIIISGKRLFPTTFFEKVYTRMFKNSTKCVTYPKILLVELTVF